MKDLKAVVGIFRSRDKAEQALTALQDKGLTFAQLKLVTPEASASSDTAATEVETPGRKTRTALSALMGGTIGISGSLIGVAAVSLFAAAGAPLVALGLPLAAIGGLTGAGVGVFAAETLELSLLQPAYHQLCEEALKQGNSLVIALADDHTQAERYREILIEAGAENLNPSREQGLVDLDSLDVGTVFAVPEEVPDHTSFATPKEVLDHDELSREQKIKILRRWYYDASSIAVAEEEGMIGNDDLMLHQILHALHQLTGGVDREHSAPTKQGSF